MADEEDDEDDQHHAAGSRESVTCPSCRVTCPQSGHRPRLLCPYCGAFYGAVGGAAPTSRVSGTAASSSRTRTGRYSHASSSTRHQAQYAHGTGRHQQQHRHVQHSSGFFPEIAVHNDHRGAGPLRAFGDFLAGRLGIPGGNVAHVTGVLIRPAAEISLPPIVRDNGGQLIALKCSSDLRSRRTAAKYEDFLTDISDDWASEYDSPPPLEYPLRRKTVDQFMSDLQEAKRSRNYDTLRDFYLMSFGSFQEINATFKKNPQEIGANSMDPGLRTTLLDTVYDKLQEMPSQVHKCVLKSMVNALLQRDKRLYIKDDLRAGYILLQNPLFGWQASFPVLAHLLRFLCSLPTGDQHLLMAWFKGIAPERMRRMVKNLLQFLTVSQFSRQGDRFLSHPPRKWWVALAMKVLALLNAVNNSSRPTKIAYLEFYNSALDHLDLMTEYYNWQNPDRPDRFSFCQYPFVLSVVAKRSILQKDSENQMIINARKSLVATIIQNEAPNLDIFFFNINVKRSNLVSDSLNEIARKQRDLKKKLRVTFVGEPGLDMGGLTKEWFLLLIRQIFHPDYGMFVYHVNQHCYWFSLTQTGNLREYNLIGVLMGLAVYNSIILDVRFPFVCYKKLLSPPVVPQTQNVPIGTCPNCTLDDLSEIMPEVARSMRALLTYEGDVEDDFGITYQVSIEEYGQMKTHNLKPTGDLIPVTKKNREEFVGLYVNWVLNRAIYEPFKAFYLGFHSVCASNALIMLRPEEVEILVCGTPNLDLDELRKVTMYDGCSAKDAVIRNFWEVVRNLSSDDQKKMLLFTTGTDRIPVGGVAEMTFKISLATDRTDTLPVSHTCFNQLVLPNYETKELLREKLIIAINNAEGFGLE